ncbi:MAG: hypothetical protein GKC10_01770, partial [Methanosarcinales archaeon]|nr:hypothetical protein [Methanosarcinales archaeon]
MALFLLAVAQAEGIDVSVTLDQIDSQNQPYDVNRTIVYSVHLSGANSSTSCSVLLEVGPDLHHSNLKNSYRDSVDLEPGKASTLYFPVDFRSSAFMGEEYQEWLLDLENASPWSLAWYRLEVISEDPTDRPVLVDDYSGWPEMIKVVQLSRDQSVTPAEGTRDDVYLYSASFFCTHKENISLQVAPSPQGPWTPLGERAYTAPGSWQTLEWEDVALNFDFETASYRFKGWEFSPAFEGPSRPILVQIQNSTVFPERALADQNFSFQVQLLATKEMEVSLVLLDPARNYTSSRGRLKYAKAPTWETLAWRDVSLLDMARFNGSTVYFFEFYTPDEEAPFATSRLLTGRYYQGPKLILMEMGNATVAPGNG